MRLWHQSLVPMSDVSAPYFESLGRHAEQVQRADTSVVLHGFDPDRYPAGFEPAAFARFEAGSPIHELHMARSVIEADRDGFEAFLIGTLQDPGVQIGRTLTDMPVVGYGQAAALLGACFGSPLGILAFNPPLVPLLEERLNAYVPGSVGPASILDVTYAELMTSFGDTAFAAVCMKACEDLIERGARVIVPGQMVLAEVMWSLGIRRVGDVPVIDGFGCLIKLAESLADLRSASGMIVNRIGFHWMRAPREITDVLEAT